MKKILLHVCCGPCAIAPITALREEGFEVTGFFMNPNIHPLSEYLKRREALAQCAEKLELPVIFVDETWNISAWLATRAGKCDNSEARCASCYKERLKAAHEFAAGGGFDAFTSTLLYSRRQKHELIAAIGQKEAETPLSGQNFLTEGSVPTIRQVPFLYRDFRPLWQQGIDSSKTMGIYRQNYCGCIYSEAERHEKSLRALISAI